MHIFYDPEPANSGGGGEPATDNPSARLESAMEKAHSEPTSTPKAEAANTPPDKAQPESDSVKTVSGQSGGAEKLPWDKDPRFQKFLKESKDIEAKSKEFEARERALAEKEEAAKQGTVWMNALKQHPKLAAKVAEEIQAIMAEANGEKPAEKPANQTPEEKDEQEKINAIAQKLIAAGPFKEILEKVSGFEKTKQTLDQERSKQEVTQRFNTVKDTYQPIFDEMVKDLKVPTRYKKSFEKNVWEKLYELSPDSVKNLTIDEPNFRKAVEHATQEFNELNNEFVSGFTKNLPPAHKPNGGKAAIQANESEDDIEKELVNSLKTLRSAG